VVVVKTSFNVLVLEISQYIIFAIDAHRGGGRKGRVNIGPSPKKNFKRIFDKNDKNEIKLKIGAPTPMAIFPESLDLPLLDF
jgi:hypothetical protein